MNEECKRNIDYASNVSLNAFTSERSLRNGLLAKQECKGNTSHAHNMCNVSLIAFIGLGGLRNFIIREECKGNSAHSHGTCNVSLTAFIG